MSVPNTFNLATGSIPLSQLDANFAYYDAAFSISGTTITFAGTMNGNLTGDVSGNAGTVTNGVYLASAQTLTNKTISGSSNTLSNIGNASLTNSAITINGSAISLGGTASVGTVTSVTGTSPVVSSGGATPAISMAAANTTTNGYLKSTDWNTFNNKQPAGTYVNSVSGTTGRTTSTGGATPAIDLASGVVTAGTTGSSTLIPIVTVDTYGRVTSLTTAANPQGTVTSVGGTGTVNGLTLTGTVTSTGNLTLGGTLDLSAPPAIGTTTPSTGAFTTLSASGNVTLGDASTDTLNVGNGGLVKDASGNVGIGTSSPTQKLTVSGSGVVSNTFTIGQSGIGDSVLQVASIYGSLRIGYNNTNVNYFDGDTQIFRKSDNGTERMRIDPSGNMSVGRTSGGGRVNIQANTNNFMNEFFNQSGSSVGSIQTNGTTTSYGTTSDYRLKDNVQPMQGALETVEQLKPCTYTWKADGSGGQGFIAHELQAVVPDCVTGEKDAVDADGNPQYQSIDTSFLVATLTAAIQELKATVDAQAARITALEQA